MRVIGPDGGQLGVMSVRKALDVAGSWGLDLVEVAPNADPPVCRIMDYGKFKYEEAKKEKQAKKRQHLVQVKEVKLRPGIQEHDYQVKLKKVREFLEKHCRVKVMLYFRGRQIMYADAGFNVMNRLAEDVKDIGVIEKAPIMEGHHITMIIVPKSGKTGKEKK